ncbi:MAG: DNA repair protein RecN [Alphaproteobacteria bacterium]|nr:DNA repair protein RecN [Alphaproteobacteria bacterium]
MLAGLSIRDFVLIDRLELRFHEGLGVLTGETGAGKSILLGALGLALGERASPSLLRPAAKQGSVTAEFVLTDHDPVRALLTEAGIPDEGERLIVRRLFGADGKSRAFVNDEPVSVSFLQKLGEGLIEIQGQFENRGLRNPATHRDALDSFGEYAAERERTAAAWDAWQETATALAAARTASQHTAAREDELRHDLAALETLDPREGEETQLAETRELLRHGEQLAAALQEATSALAGEPGVSDALGRARKQMERQAAQAQGRFDPVLENLEAAAIAVAEAESAIARLGDALGGDPGQLEEAEARLFALRAAARKHGVAVDGLAEFRNGLQATLQKLEVAAEELREGEARVAACKEAYLQAARALSAARAKAATRLDKAILKELAPIKLERAVFRTAITALEEPRWSRDGIDRVAFEGTMNPGTPPGPLAKIASGGELSRLMLALKVVLSRANPVPTLIFDEVDSGIGGAVATAVGERLARLGSDLQVLVVTHSPQVAAVGAHHWLVQKSDSKAGVVTDVTELSKATRREEIARMLAGAQVTDEARAAADQLLRTGAA